MISGGEILNVTYPGKFSVIKDSYFGEKEYHFDEIASAIKETDTVWSNVTKWLEINWRETFDGVPKIPLGPHETFINTMQWATDHGYYAPRLTSSGIDAIAAANIQHILTQYDHDIHSLYYVCVSF